MRPGLSSLKPSLYVYEFDQNWRLVQQQLHHIEGLNYAHDFLLLPDYYVFHMTPFVSSTLQDAIKVYMGLTAPGRLVRHYSSLPSRFVVVPRHKEAHYQEIMMFDVEPLHVRVQCNKCCCIMLQYLPQLILCILFPIQHRYFTLELQSKEETV